MEGLRDIKEIVEVQDYSLFTLLGLIFVAFIIMIVAFYIFKNRRKRRKKATAKEIAMQKLQGIDYSNAKEVVYTFQESARLFLDEKNSHEFEEIVKELAQYKYKKEVPSLEDAHKNRIEKFIRGLK